MKYLIWGTGRCAKEILNDYAMAYFKEHSILAFVDNDIEKCGGTFYTKEVIPPKEIERFLFDRILICSRINEKAILKQITDVLKINRKNVMTLKEFDDEYYNDLINKKSLLNSRVLMVGDRAECQLFKEQLNSLQLYICGIVDVQNMEEIREYSFDYIMLYRLMNIPSLNRQIGRMRLEGNISEYISKTYKISKERILTDVAVESIKWKERRVSFGEENEDKIFLLVRFHSPTIGLGTFVLMVAKAVDYAKERGYIPVVDMTISNQYLEAGEAGRVNAWEKFFEQPCGYSLSDIQKSKNVIVIYGIRDTPENLNFNFLKLKPMLKKSIETYKSSLKKEEIILGVLFRGTDYTNRKAYKHTIQPDLETMILKVKQKIREWGYFDRIYLCTEVEEAVLRFREEFQDKFFCYPQERISKNYCGYLSEYKFARENAAYLRGADYWAALSVLSECNSLIAGWCTGTNVALILNQDHYRHKYIFDLGVYGIDDI